MRKIALSAALALAPLLAAPAAAQDAVPLAALSDYFNDITTAEGDFTQINADGSVSTGRFYMQRPGRMRFEYEGEPLLVMAGGGQLAVFDGRARNDGDLYPLRETPLSLILANEVDLTRSGMVVSHAFDGTATRVVAQDPDRPETGYLTLVFTSDPVELRQWIVTDSSGQDTTVVLGALELGGRISARLFNVVLEVDTRRGTDR